MRDVTTCFGVGCRYSVTSVVDWSVKILELDSSSLSASDVWGCIATVALVSTGCRKVMDVEGCEWWTGSSTL